MLESTIDITVRLKIRHPKGVTAEEVIENLDYCFTSQTPSADIFNHEITENGDSVTTEAE